MAAVDALLAVEAALKVERQNKSQDDDTEFLDEIIEMTSSVAGLLSSAGDQAARQDEL